MEHIMDAIPNFRKIIEHLERIKKEIVSRCGIDYKSQDARMVALDSIQISISAVGMWIQGLNSLANTYTNNGVLDETNFLRSVGSGVDVKNTEMIMLDHLRLGFMTLVHFKFDNLFQNILNHLNALPHRKGYYNLTDKILDQCSLPINGIEKKLLTAFANLRNSLHGNGIHRTPSLSITVNGMTFDFIKDERIECASWKHIIILLQSNVNILEKILLSQVILNITEEITDEYASGEMVENT